MSAATRQTACLDRLRPVSPAKALHQLRNHLPALAGERLATFWIRQSTLETAFKLCRDSLSQWSWIWRQPRAYVRLWRASRCLTRSRRLAHNHRFRTRLESLSALAALNDAQRHAVVNLDDRVFVSAGAGSGKTRVIEKKVRHVVRQRVARPEHVAVITFTKDATKVVRDRLRDVAEVTVKTIHGIAMQVIVAHGLKCTVSDLAQDGQQTRRLTAISRWLDEALAENPDLLFELYERGEAFRRHEVPRDSAPLPLVPPRDTPVRSMGEARIALTLYACGLSYQYEKELDVPEHLKNRQHSRYHPDFFIPDDPDEVNPPPEAGIWLEHYSHDREGNLPSEYLASDPDAHRRYNREREWKRRLFKAMRLRYVETTYGDIEVSRERGESFPGLLVSRLNERRRAPIAAPSPSTIEQALRSLLMRDRAGPRRIAKEIDAWIRAWRQRSRRMRRRRPPGLTRDGRAAAVALEMLSRPVMARWEQYLEDTGTEDFEGIILRASGLLEKTEAAVPWRVVLLDEAQDVNPAQADFVEALTGPLRSGVPQRRALFTAVGDAWQAIFGFQGGDPSYLDDGGMEEDPQAAYTSRIDLDRTYRHGDPIAQTARAYVLRLTGARDRAVKANPQGFRDERWPSGVSLGSCRPTAEGIAFLGGEERAARAEGATAGILCVLKRIGESRARAGDKQRGCVLVLCRQNAGLVDRSKSAEQRAQDIFQDWEKDLTRLPDFLWGKSRDQRWHHALKEAGKQEGFCHAQVCEAAAVAGVNIKFLTIHGAKGAEADYVIVLDAGLGTTRERASAKALDEALLPVRGRIVQDEEEHRIGYVALTRARRKTYLLLTPAGEEKSLWGHSLWRNEYREYDVSEEELLELLEPLRPNEPCPTCESRGTQGETLVFKERLSDSDRPVSCTSFRGLNAKERFCGHRERACDRCEKGIMVRDSQGLSRCHNRRCGWEVPLCGCTVPKPMKVWTRRRDGHQFLGCQDYRRDSRGCRATEILAWRERPTERQWWNVQNPKRLAMNRVALLADLDDDMANLTLGGGRQLHEPTHGPAQATRTATGPQTVPARSAKPTCSVPPALWSDGDVLHETADADQEPNVDVEQWERTQPPASAYVADEPSDVAFESLHGAADADDEEEREDDEWSAEDEEEWWEAAEDSSELVVLPDGRVRQLWEVVDEWGGLPDGVDVPEGSAEDEDGR